MCEIKLLIVQYQLLTRIASSFSAVRWTPAHSKQTVISGVLCG